MSLAHSQEPRPHEPIPLTDGEFVGALRCTNGGPEAFLHIVANPGDIYDSKALDSLFVDFQGSDAIWIPAANAGMSTLRRDAVSEASFVQTDIDPYRVRISTLGRERVRPLSAQLIARIVLPHEVSLNILLGEGGNPQNGHPDVLRNRLHILSGLWLAGHEGGGFMLADTYDPNFLSRKTATNHLSTLEAEELLEIAGKRDKRGKLSEKGQLVLRKFCGLLYDFIMVDPDFMDRGQELADKMQHDNKHTQLTAFMSLSQEHSSRATPQAGAISAKLIIGALVRGPMRGRDLVEVVGLRPDRTRTVLHQLKDDGLLRCWREGKHSWWELA